MPDVNARILLWGIEGAGKTTTLETIHAKLRPDLRGELRTEATRLDPTVHFESLAIQLGETAGVSMQIEIVAVPGAPDQEMTRKQLLDEVDGIVIVLDASPKRIEENFAAIEELKSSLAAYGHRLDAFPIVLQYNKRDIADPFAIEALHRRIGLDQAAVFETIATTGHGILSTLTTISKNVVRARRSEGAHEADEVAITPTTASASEPEIESAAQPIAEPLIEAVEEAIDEGIDESIAEAVLESENPEVGAASHEILEAAIIAESENETSRTFEELVELDPETGTQPNWDAASESVPKPEERLGTNLRIVSTGQAGLDADGTVQLPLVLGDESGQTRSVVLSLRLDSIDVSDAGGND